MTFKFTVHERKELDASIRLIPHSMRNGSKPSKETPSQDVGPSSAQISYDRVFPNVRVLPDKLKPKSRSPSAVPKIYRDGNMKPVKPSITLSSPLGLGIEGTCRRQSTEPASSSVKSSNRIPTRPSTAKAAGSNEQTISKRPKSSSVKYSSLSSEADFMNQLNNGNANIAAIDASFNDGNFIKIVHDNFNVSFMKWFETP